jgi:hypothetical protein
MTAGLRARIAGPDHVVQNTSGLTRRKPDKRRVALTPAVVALVIASEAYDGRSPHLRLFASRVSHQLDERLGVSLSDWVREGCNKSRHTQFGGLGFVFRHSCYYSAPKANLLELRASR